MDNASKALIIAGAVLIAVMLVSIGVLVYQSAVGQVNNALQKQDATNISLYNSTYSFYTGAGQSRSKVCSLLETIKGEYDANAEHTIEVTFATCPDGTPTSASGTTASASCKTAIEKIQKASNYTYDIQFEKDTSGYINKCKITGKQ